MSSNHKSGCARFCKCETVKGSLHTAELCSSLSSKDLNLFFFKMISETIFLQTCIIKLFSCCRNCCLSFSISKDTMLGRKSARRAQPPPGPQYTDTPAIRSRNASGHVTIWYPRCHFLQVLHCNRVCISRRFPDIQHHTYQVTTLPFQGHVTSSVM